MLLWPMEQCVGTIRGIKHVIIFSHVRCNECVFTYCMSMREHFNCKETLHWFDLGAKALTLLSWILGKPIRGNAPSPYLTSANMCGYWRRMKKISFSLASAKAKFKAISMSVEFQRQLHVKDPFCSQNCAPGPHRSGVSHSGTLLYFDVTESYGSNQACSVYAWSQHQPELHIMTVRVLYVTLLRVTGNDCNQLEIHRIPCGISCATRAKTRVMPGWSWDKCLRGQGCCEGPECVMVAVSDGEDIFSQMCPKHATLFIIKTRPISKTAYEVVLE